MQAARVILSIPTCRCALRLGLNRCNPQFVSVPDPQRALVFEPGVGGHQPKPVRLMLSIAAMLAFASALAFAQPPASAAIGHLVTLSSSSQGSSTQVHAGEIVREIDDPSNGNHWLLVRNADHPAGPGLLLLVSAAHIQAMQAEPVVEPVLPVIRTGDRVIVEENTPLVDARLEAVAMSPAMAGSPFNVLLSIGGRIIRAVATGPGRATLQEEAAR
jgi:hypothetical protein